MHYILIWIEKLTPAGHLPGLGWIESPKSGLQRPESAIWPKCGMSASGSEEKGGSSYSQASNADNISKLLAFGCGSIFETQ